MRHILCFFIAVKSVENNYYWEGKHMSRVGNKMQEKFMSMKFRGKEIFKPHDPNAPCDGYDESDDTEQNAKSVLLTKVIPVVS